MEKRESWKCGYKSFFKSIHQLNKEKKRELAERFQREQEWKKKQSAWLEKIKQTKAKQKIQNQMMTAFKSRVKGLFNPSLEDKVKQQSLTEKLKKNIVAWMKMTDKEVEWERALLQQ